MRKWTDDQLQQISDAYRNGESSGTIAKRFGTSAVNICTLLTRRLGMKLRYHTRRISLNQNAFDDAQNNPEAAYYLGLFFADGCVIADKRSKETNYKLVLALAEQDMEHVHDFRRFLSSSHKVSLNDNSRGFGTGKIAFLSFYSRHIANVLNSYGITERKSSTAKIIGLENNIDFWRGVVCGDGYVSLREKPYLGITGSYDSCKQFSEFCSQYTKSYASIIKHKGCFGVTFCGRKAIIIIRRLFYQGCIALKRKLDVANFIIDKFKLISEEQLSDPIKPSRLFKPAESRVS